MSLLGYDIVYDPRSAREILRDPAIRSEDRIVLGRCPSLAADGAFGERFSHIESADLNEQLAQVTRAFPQDFARTLFTRCSHCNATLRGPIPVETVEERLPPLVRECGKNFHLCPQCDRLYWEATHTERIRERLREAIALSI